MSILKMQLCAIAFAGLFCMCCGQVTEVFPDFPDGPAMVTCETYQCPPTATCRQRTTYVYCECPYGKTGMNCEEDDPCLPRVAGCPEGFLCYGECNPNVVCIGATGIAQCSGCLTGWTAENCQTDVDECEEFLDICLNGGKCTNSPGDYSCDCAKGWTGKDCFCKKGTSCDVADVKDKEQHSIDNPDEDSQSNKDLSDGNSAGNLQLNLILTLSVVVFSVW